MLAYWNQVAPERGWGTPVPADSEAPGLIDPETRAVARAEIDAVVARTFFDLAREELATILDTFPVLRRREEKFLGGFRTKIRVLEEFDKLVAAGNIENAPSVLDRLQ
jgi:hypothetical protein